MHHSSATRQRAAGAGALSGRAHGSTPSARRRTLSTVEQLHQVSMRLDELIRDVSFTPQPRSHHEVDRRIAEAEEIAIALRALFRSTQPVAHPPIWQDGQGKAAW
jgi:hypothetical protein